MMSQPLAASGTIAQAFGIGWAVKEMRNGSRVRRAGWNGKNMHLELQVSDAHSKMTLPYVYMFTAQGDLVPWVCSQTDLFAVDWEISPRCARSPSRPSC